MPGVIIIAGCYTVDIRIVKRGIKLDIYDEIFMNSLGELSENDLIEMVNTCKFKINDPHKFAMMIINALNVCQHVRQVILCISLFSPSDYPKYIHSCIDIIPKFNKNIVIMPLTGTFGIEYIMPYNLVDSRTILNYKKTIMILI